MSGYTFQSGLPSAPQRDSYHITGMKPHPSEQSSSPRRGEVGKRSEPGEGRSKIQNADPSDALKAQSLSSEGQRPGKETVDAGSPSREAAPTDSSPTPNAVPKGIGITILSDLGKIRIGVDKLQVWKADQPVQFHAIGTYIGRSEGKAIVDFDGCEIALPWHTLREPKRFDSWINVNAFADGYMRGFAARHEPNPVMPDYRDTEDPVLLGKLKGWCDASRHAMFRADRAIRMCEPYNQVVRAFLLPDNAAGVTLAMQLEPQAPLPRASAKDEQWKEVTAKFKGSTRCGHGLILPGDVIGWQPSTGMRMCATCWAKHKEEIGGDR